MNCVLKSLFLTLASLSYCLAVEIGKVEVSSLTSDTHGTGENSHLRFSWKLKAEGKGQLQGSYRILVADSEEKLKPEGELIWDSGEVKSFQSIYVPYEGPKLAPGKEYFWQVQLANNEEEKGEWSKPARFTLKPKDESSAREISAPKSLGGFECSDEDLNILFKEAFETQKTVLTSPASFEPENLPWGAPLQLTARGFSFQTDLSDYYRAANEALFAKVGEDKLIPSLVEEHQDAAASPGFSEAGIVIPFALWQLTGDPTLAEPSFLAAVNHVGLMQKNDPDYEGKPFGNDLGDWGHQNDPTSQGFLSLCHLALNCRILGEVATAVGHLPYIVQHKEWFSRIRKAFPEHHLEDGKLKEKSQTAQILALRFGLLPQELKQPTADALAERLEEEGLKAGQFGQAAVLPVLSWTNHHEQAIQLAKGYHAENAKPTPVALASTAEWMMSFLAGFVHQAPGFKTARISPFIPEDGSISEVKAFHETPYGRLAIHWKKTEESLTATVTVPPNTTAVVSLPGDENATVTESGKSLEDAPRCQLMQELNGRKEIIAQSGTYQFVVK